MNTPKFYRELEGDNLRGDSDEGLDSQWSSPKTETILEANGIPIGKAEKARIRNNDIDSLNLFCMLAIKSLLATPIIDPRNFDFGDTFVLIDDYNIPRFFERVKKAAEKENIKWQGKFVEYVNNDYNGEMGVFKKFKGYEYQSEFRIIVWPGFDKLYRLNIGDISDISCTGRAKDLATLRIGKNFG